MGCPLLIEASLLFVCTEAAGGSDQHQVKLCEEHHILCSSKLHQQQIIIILNRYDAGQCPALCFSFGYKILLKQAMPRLVLVSFLGNMTELYLMADVVSIMSCDWSAQNQITCCQVLFILLFFHILYCKLWGWTLVLWIRAHVWPLVKANKINPIKYNCSLRAGLSTSDPVQFKTGLTSYFYHDLCCWTFVNNLIAGLNWNETDPSPVFRHANPCLTHGILCW